MFDGGVCGWHFVYFSKFLLALLYSTRYPVMLLSGCTMPSGSGFTNTRACTPMPGIVVLARGPRAPSRAALLNSRASLGRQLDSKPWSSRGMFMYYFTNVFIVFFGG